MWGVVLSFFCGGGREQRRIHGRGGYMEEEGSEKICVHEEDEEEVEEE